MIFRSLTLMFTAIAFFSAEFTAFAAPQGTKSAKVSDFVWSQLARKMGGEKPGSQNKITAEITVIFADQADFSDINNFSFSSREERVGYVYKKLVQTANKTQKKMVRKLRRRGFKVQQFFITNAILIENATQELVNQLAESSLVSRIVGNPSIGLKLPDYPGWKSDGVKAIGPNLSAIGADRVWKEFGVKGQNIVIAGQDTGVQWDHPALMPSYRGFNKSISQENQSELEATRKVDHNYSWHDAIRVPFNDRILSGEKTNKCGYDLKEPCDDDEHGTHTMGTMVGDDGVANTVGVAPSAKWIACRNMDAGAGKPATYLDCFQFFLAPTPLGGNPFTQGRPAKAPHVINNSWGCPPEEGCSGDEFVPALKALKAAGIMTVVSAGNDGPGCSTIQDPPAWHSSLVLSVGAHDHRSGRIASFSSRGPSTRTGLQGPNVTAPGVSIRSTVPGNGYAGGMWSGTSMAGPHVAGQVALMWSAAPDLIGDIDGTIALIQATAEPAVATQACGGEDPNATPNNTFGYGRIRIYDAVKAAMAGVKK